MVLALHWKSIAPLLCAACLALPRGAAFAEEPLPELPPAPPMMPPDMVCRWEADTGSYIRRKVCRTPAEEAAEQAAARHLLDQMRQNRAGGNRRINGVSTADGSAVRN